MLVWDFRLVPRSVSVTVTVAPATGAPDGSVTDPVITPVACCARSGRRNQQRHHYHPCGAENSSRFACSHSAPFDLPSFRSSGSGSRQS